MIDIENDVFDYVAKALRTAYSGIDVRSEYTEQPAKFPHVSLVEADNRVLENMRTDSIENGILSMIEVNIYSNRPAGKKAEAKAIAATVDELLTAIGYTRTFREQVPNLRDSTIYRIVCRYEAHVDRNLVIYHT